MKGLEALIVDGRRELVEQILYVQDE